MKPGSRLGGQHYDCNKREVFALASENHRLVLASIDLLSCSWNIHKMALTMRLLFSQPTASIDRPSIPERDSSIS